MDLTGWLTDHYWIVLSGAALVVVAALYRLSLARPEILIATKEWKTERIKGITTGLPLAYENVVAFIGGIFGRQEGVKENMQASISYPRLLSKGRPGKKFVFHMYPQSCSDEARKQIQNIIDTNMEEKHSDARVNIGSTVIVRLCCPAVQFTPLEATIRIENGLNRLIFIGKVTDDACNGDHEAILSITLKDTLITVHSAAFNIRIVDYLFDHVSRPLASGISSALSGCAAITSFALVSIEQIDKVSGYGAGSTLALLAVLFFRFGYVPFRINNETEI